MMRPLASLPLVLPLLAVPLILVTTSGETAIRPIGAVLVGTAILFAALAGTGGAKPRPWIDLPLASLLGLAASHLLFAPGLPRGHDTLHHLWGIWAVAGEVAGGHADPLWLHGIGLGTPLLQFYGPTSFYVALLFSLAGLSPAAALKGALLVFGSGAAVAMHIAVTRWTGDRRAGLIAAAAYSFAPYRLLDSHYRAALGETAALALLPLVFLCGVAAAREGGRLRLAAAAAGVALLIVTHPISALLAVLGLGIWTLAETGPHLGKRIARLAVACALGAGLAGFFVVPFAVEGRHLVLRSIAQGGERHSFFEHGLHPGELVQRRLWTDLGFSAGAGEPLDGTDREMPFYFGIGLLALMPLAAGLGKAPGEETSPSAPKGLLWMLVAALALSLRPVAQVASLVLPPLAALQFAWRSLGLATFAAAAGAGFAAARLLNAGRGRRWAPAIPGVLAALLLFDAYPFTGAPDWYPPFRQFGWIDNRDPDCGRRWGCWEHEAIEAGGAVRIAGMFVPPPEPEPMALYCCAYHPEYMTPEAAAAFYPEMHPEVLARAGVQLVAEPGSHRVERRSARPYATWRGKQGAPEPRRFARGGGEVTVELDGRSGTVLVLEQVFPGWQVLTPAGWREVQPSQEGLLQARAVPGQRIAAFRLRRWTPDRIAGWLLTGATMISLLALVWGRKEP